uniref:Major facilitator superfamily (MFS) profile domain-containing protein n=1 Tax=Lactuca sativa TaxID=4236 RepID=A0A9R1WUU3_LACSA|nr:hypothetical protein LSAT_V11C900502010 [Lactuca sativa]
MNPFRLVAVGLLIWTFAAIGCGISVVGVGEASFISLAAPFIDENAPPKQRSAWLGIFYMCIPTGIALGYVYGGLASDVGGSYGWRYAFLSEAVMMVPFVILGFVMKPLHLKGITNAKNAAGSSKDKLGFVLLLY